MSLEMLKVIIFFAMAALIGGGLLITGVALMLREFFAGRRSDDTFTGHKEHGELGTRTVTREHIAIIREEVRKARREVEESLGKRITMIEANMAKLNARDAYQNEAWETAALWWSRALKDYAYLNEQTLLRTAIQRLRGDLEKCQMINDTVKEEIASSLPLIPDTLESEKDVIEERLKQLSKPAEREAA